MDTMTGKTIVLVYVGRKKVKTDTVCRSGIVWFGYGDAQEVPYSIASKLRKHPDVWVTAEEFKKFPEALPEKESKPAGEGFVIRPKETLDSPGDDGDLDDDSDKDLDDGDSGGEASTGDLETIIKNAILSLDPDNGDHFGAKGPKVAAIQAATGDKSITAKQVKPVWESMK
jgi:hypothetical protein